MPKFMISYIGAHPVMTPEEQKAHFQAYKAWLASLGEAAISPANPFLQTITLAADGSRSTGSLVQMSGYTLVQVPSIEDAVKIAADCPFLSIGGSLEVSEIGAMPI